LKEELPKIIWFLWLQGMDDAPFIVQKCLESWLRHNPGWQVILLDRPNAREYIDLESEIGPIGDNVTPQAFSDILRINLLAKYGGVWADATCFCTKPLDDWLGANMETGFFAIERPAPDRMISSWFIASFKYNYIALTYKNKVNAYWRNNPDMRFFDSFSWQFLNRRLRRIKTGIWFSIFVNSILKVYPYFWFHYLFGFIYHRDARFREMWDSTPKFSADIPHKLQIAGLFNPINDDVRAHLGNKVSPMYKLTWRYQEADYKKDTILFHLLND
jgi:hypothetical protein